VCEAKQESCHGIFRAPPRRSTPFGWWRLVTIVEDEIRFWNGSKIYLCHYKDPKDVYKYQGTEIHAGSGARSEGKQQTITGLGKDLRGGSGAQRG
jgi:hypothetical protein